MRTHEPLHGGEIVVPQSLTQGARLHNARPAGGLIQTGEQLLRVGELGGGGITTRPMLDPLRPRDGITRAERTMQLFGLMAELVQIGTNGQATNRHTNLLETPGVRWHRAKEGREKGTADRTTQEDSVLSADGRRPARRPECAALRSRCQSESESTPRRRCSRSHCTASQPITVTIAFT